MRLKEHEKELAVQIMRVSVSLRMLERDLITFTSPIEKSIAQRIRDGGQQALDEMLDSLIEDETFVDRLTDDIQSWGNRN